MDFINTTHCEHLETSGNCEGRNNIHRLEKDNSLTLLTKKEHPPNNQQHRDCGTHDYVTSDGVELQNETQASAKAFQFCSTTIDNLCLFKEMGRGRSSSYVGFFHMRQSVAGVKCRLWIRFL